MKIIEDNDFPPDLVFNVDETGCIDKSYRQELISWWRKKQCLASRYPRTDLLRSLDGMHQALKLKPLLVCHSKIPRVMKGFLKYHFPVIWISNRKALIMHQIFSEWYSKHFCHSVLQFCNQNNLPRKALLSLDNAPGHPPNLEDVKSELEVKTVFFAP